MAFAGAISAVTFSFLSAMKLISLKLTEKLLNIKKLFTKYPEEKAMATLAAADRQKTRRQCNLKSYQ